jgi:hypothetical protein
MTDLQTFYPQNPWGSVATKERTPWYFPTLYDEFRRRSVYNRFAQVAFNHNGPRATELIVTSLMMPHANHDPIGVRDMWLNASYMDTFYRKVTFSRYAAKMSLNRYDDMITYLERDGVRGLDKIIREGLGVIMVNQMEKLARDAFMRAPFALYGDGSGGLSGDDFSAIDSSDIINTRLLGDIRLGMFERDNPAFDNELGMGESLVCITSPGVIEDLRFEASTNENANAFIDVMKYANPQSIISGEVGMYHGVRFIKANNAVLHNAGTIIQQRTIDAPVAAGDGSPNPGSTAVDSIEYVGQTASAHSITVSDTTGINVGDIVTIHVDRTSAKGITNGVDWTDGKATTRRVVAKSGTTGGTLSFDRPLLEAFSTDLGGGVYGYVTKGQNIHTALFLSARDGVVIGMAQPPTIHLPRPVDDLDMIQRITYDMYAGWNVFNKHSFELVFLAGSNRYTGARYITKT